MTKAQQEQKITEIYSTLYDAFGPQHWWPGETPFEVAVGAILTQNTNWGNVEKAVYNLKKHGILSTQNMIEMSEKQLASLIKPAGYFNVKAGRLKEFLNFLEKSYSGSMEQLKAENTQSIRQELLGVNGIGPETADSILLYALDKPVFVIDAYTKRILGRHNLVSENTPYHELQEIFHKSLPRNTELFNEFHALIVRLGKYYCKTRPACSGCPLEKMK